MHTGLVGQQWLFHVVVAVLVVASAASCKPREKAEIPVSADTPVVVEVRDAMTNAGAVAVEGGRFKVLMVDEQGTAGLARIGERIVVIPDGRKGDVAVVEVTRIGDDAAEAVLVERLASGHPLPEPAPVAEAPVVEESMVGQLFRMEIPEVNADGQGIVSLRGKPVVVPGVKVGERVEFRILEETPDGAVAEIVERLDIPAAEAKPAEATEEIDYSKAVPKRRAVPADPEAKP